MTIRRFLCAPPAAPGPLARLSAYVVASGWLVYAGEKVYMSAIGQIGMPGHVAPASVQDRFDHASLAQAGNAGLGILAATVALGTVHRWTRRIPAPPMLAVLVVASVPIVAGMVVMFTRLPDDANGSASQVGLEGVLIGFQALPWLVVVTTFAGRTLRARNTLASVRREAGA